MSFLNRILEVPRYGYERDGELIKPSVRTILGEFAHRCNFVRDRRNWLAFFGWWSSFLLIVPAIFFFTDYFSWPLALWGFVYSMVIMGTHGTIYYHRYGTHRAYTFSNTWSGRVARFVTRNLVIKIIPEETYIVSHHVHHFLSEKPGDPYNVNGGFWYCFMADVTQQPIAKDLSKEEYQRLTHMVEHTGQHINSYEMYKKWGTLCHPAFMIGHFIANWAFWAAFFYVVGGPGLAMATFAGAFFWAFGVRTFNFSGHGAGKDKRQEGIDFFQADHSINQNWPGLITGEWHNNHHLYPNGARAGFLPNQIDFAWWYIKGLSVLGLVSHYRDFKADFYKTHYEPYLAKKRAEQVVASSLQESSVSAST